MLKIGQIHERVVSTVHQGQWLRSIESSTHISSVTCWTEKAIIIFLPAGLKYSAGPSRIFVRYARELAKDGFLCYRFDPFGIGNSDGSLEPGSTKELWNRIEKGYFVENLATFITHIRKRNPDRKIAICGLCGGAVTAILFAGKYKTLVDGIISINTEPFLSLTTPSSPTAETATQINRVIENYSAKLLSATAWARLFSLESDIKGILRFAKLFLLRQLKNDNRKLHEFENINEPLVQAFRKAQQERIKHLMLFAEHSSSWHRFQGTLFPNLMKSNCSSSFGEIKIIRNANHELQAKEWRGEALGYIREWLNYGGFNRR